MAHNQNEIERAWVVSELPSIELVTHSVYHEIGYLVVTDPSMDSPGELRVYRKKLPDRWKFGITVKGMGDVSRKEWEDKEFPEWAFCILWQYVEDRIVYKTRHFSPMVFNNVDLLLEVDEYHNNLEGLIRLECEFESEEQAEKFWLPSWVKNPNEVTYDKRFKNSRLSTLSKEEFKELMNDLPV